MKLQYITSPLFEMGKPAQVCPQCGHGPMHKTHYYYKGTWKCKNAPLPGYPQSGGQSAGSTPAPSQTPSAAPAAPKTATPKPTPAPTAAPAAPKTITPVAGGPSVTVAPTAKTTTRISLPQGDFESNVKRFFEEFRVADSDITKNEDGTYTIKNTLNMTGCVYHGIPVKIKKVEGDMKISSYIKTLKNAPDEVTEDFDITLAKYLKNLKGGPQKVGGHYAVTDCPELESLEGVASEIGGDFDCTNNPKLTSLKGIHELITSVGGHMNFANSGIKGGVLGLMLIDSLEEVTLPNVKVTEIINKHLKSEDRDVAECQEELIDAGFADWAEM